MLKQMIACVLQQRENRKVRVIVKELCQYK